MNGLFENTVSLLISAIAIPAVAAVIILLLPARAVSAEGVAATAKGGSDGGNGWIALAALACSFIISIITFGRQLVYTVPWGGFGIDFSIRLDSLSSFIFISLSGLSFLVVMYCISFLKNKSNSKRFYAYLLLTVAFATGAVLASNLVVMLFFWEGLLVTLFALIMTGRREAFATAVKAVILVGVGDLCLMLGIGMAGSVSGTLAMDKMHMPVEGWGIFAFTFMMIGAISKGGSMPFHSWIPDASLDAPLPFMAILPAALEKLLGIYLLARISLELFDLQPGTVMSVVVMAIGAVTIILAVMMALIQKDFKRLLSYHAISQVGYMILGIGTALPVGIVGGLFHMINNAMYKCCLFLTGGSVERQTGTTDLRELGGLGRKMPVTFASFLVAAAAISGLPPLNGFFSKELVFDAALESGWIFYAAAAIGAFFTAASFLKLGHAAFLGKTGKACANATESPWPMLVPMAVIALGCIVFGVYNPLPINGLIQPALGAKLEGEGFAGLPHNWLLVAVSVGVLLLALLNHLYGSKRTKSGLGAVDHIHYAPGLHGIYDLAEKHRFDPYNIGMLLVGGAARLFWWVDRGINWVYDVFSVKVASGLSYVVRRANTGSHAAYVSWSVIWLALVALIALVF